MTRPVVVKLDPNSTGNAVVSSRAAAEKIYPNETYPKAKILGYEADGMEFEPFPKDEATPPAPPASAAKSAPKDSK